MTDKARELLERALIDFECAKEYTGIDYCIVDKIRTYLAKPEVKRDDEPIGYVYSEYGSPRKNVALSNDSIPNGTPVYLHPAPRKFVRLSDEEIMDIYMKWINDNNGQPLGRAIEDALEEKNK